MPEAAAALPFAGEALFGAAEAAPAVLGAGEGILGATAEGLPFIAGGAAEAAAPAAATITVPGVVEAAAPAATAAIPGLFEGLGGAIGPAAAGLGSIFGPSEAVAATPPAPGGATPAEVVAGGFGALPEGGAAPPTSAGDLLRPGPIPGGPAGGTAAASVAAPEGVTATPDPTSAVPTPTPRPFTAPGGGVGEGMFPEGGTATAYAPEPAASPATKSIDELLTTGRSASTGLQAPQTLQAPAAAAKPEPGFLETATKYAPLAGAAVGGTGLFYSILNRPTGVPSVSQSAAAEQALTGPATATGAALTSTGLPLTKYIGTDYLPGPEQTALDQATSAAKQNLISSMAARGLPTDPTKNSVLAQNLADLDKQALATKVKIQGQLAATGTSLISAGLTQTQLAKSIYDSLIQIDQTQTANMGKAIANFAASLSGRGPTIQIGGTKA